MEHAETPWMIKEALFHDLETGKPIGTEYWILDINNEEIACNENEQIARRIVAAVNACEGVGTKLLEDAHINNIMPELIMERNRLRIENARLLEALKAMTRFCFTDDETRLLLMATSSGGNVSDALIRRVAKIKETFVVARAAIAEAENTEPDDHTEATTL